MVVRLIHKLVRTVVDLSLRHPRQVFLLVAGLSCVFGYFAFKIEMDTDVQGILPKTSKVQRLLEQYGTELPPEYLVLAVESEDLYHVDMLQAVEAVIRAIDELPHVRASMTPFNFPIFVRQEGRVILQPMASGGAPRTPEATEEFEQRLRADPLARNLVVSGDGMTLSAVFSIDRLENYSALLQAIRDVIADAPSSLRIYLAGSAPLVRATNDHLVRDLPRLLCVALALMALSFFVGFRSRRSIVLPLLVIVIGTLWTIGLMSILGFQLTVVSLMTPPLVLILGSSYSIHVLSEYYRQAPESRDNSREWVADAVFHVNRTVLMAAATTIIGFSGLLSAQVRQIREFSIATSAGVLFCAVLSLILLPAALSVVRPPSVRERKRVAEGTMSRLMVRLSQWLVRRRVLVIVFLVAVTAGFALSVGHLRYETNYLAYFKKGERAVSDNLHVIRTFGGYLYTYITLTAPEGSPGYFLDSGVLKRISEFENRLLENPDISYVSSFVTYLKAMNLALYGRFDVPDRNALALLLARQLRSIASTPLGAGPLGTLVNNDFSELTIALRVWDSEREDLMYEDDLKRFVLELQQMIDQDLAPETMPVIWGPTLISLEVSQSMATSQISSALISLCLVFFVTALWFRSARLGVLTLVPVLTGIMLSFTLTALLGIPLDIVTVMFGSIVVGVGMDDSIHLINQYRRASMLHNDRDRVLTVALTTAGRPILHTSISLIAGLLALTMSGFMPIVYFGLLVSLAITTTTVGALVVLPAMLVS